MPAAPAPNKRALLVGINRYQFVSGLQGCVNDVRLMERLLVDRFGFAPPQVTVLTDEAATRDAILAALDQLVADTAPGDVVVFHYAGHGSQMTDREGDEASGMDNTLVPVDSGRDWRAQGGACQENRDITDDELGLRLNALADRTPHVTVLVDACHSGTITRDVGGGEFGVRSRGVEPDRRPPAELPPSPIPTEARARLMAGAHSATRGSARDLGTAPGLSSPVRPVRAHRRLPRRGALVRVPGGRRGRRRGAGGTARRAHVLPGAGAERGAPRHDVP